MGIRSRQAILAGAFRLFAERGYRGATTRELAKAAGVAEVTLFRQFGTKEHLFREAVAACSPIANAGPLPLGEGPPRKGLAAVGGFALRTLIANQGVIRILLGEAGRHPAVGEAIFSEMERKIFHPLEAGIARWQKQGLLLPGSPTLLARSFLGMFFYLFLTEVYLGRRTLTPARQAQVVRRFVSTFLEGAAP